MEMDFIEPFYTCFLTYFLTYKPISSRSLQQHQGRPRQQNGQAISGRLLCIHNAFWPSPWLPERTPHVCMHPRLLWTPFCARHTERRRKRHQKSLDTRKNENCKNKNCTLTVPSHGARFMFKAYVRSDSFRFKNDTDRFLVV